MSILPLISTIFIVLSAIFVAIGLVHIKRGEETKHINSMITAAVFACSFFIIYVSRTALLGNTSFGGPDSIKIYYVIFLIFHIFLATVGAVLGVFTIYLGLKRKLKLHRKIGPITAYVWFGSAFSGLITYLLLYVIYPGGETTSLIKAILGL